MQTQSLSYESINDYLIRVCYSVKGKKNRIIARVVRPGTYKACLIDTSSIFKNKRNLK
jgi:hypothetical protein